MDSYSTQKPKSRKIKRLAKKPRVQIILDLFFRAIETIIFLVTVAKLCYQLLVTFHDSGVAAVILANRNLAFVVGNLIVIALISESGLLLNQEVVLKRRRNDLYEEFVRESSRRDIVSSRSEMINRGKQSEVENEAKQSITETRSKQSEAVKETQSVPENISKQSITDEAEGHKKIQPQKLIKQSKHQEITDKKMEEQNLAEKRQILSYQRSQSENLEGLKKSYCGRLRRSETDASSERLDSDDELRYKIESFIARQRRNLNDD